MNAFGSSRKALAPAGELASFLPDGQITLPDLHAEDRQLIHELGELHEQTPRYYSEETGLYFGGPELAGLARSRYDVASLSRIEEFLVNHDTLQIPVIEGYTVNVDGIDRDVTLVAATETSAEGANHGDMSSMVYIRDQVQAASALMKLYLLDPDRYGAEGKLGNRLLVSSLHLLSTQAQLRRFDDVIARGPDAGQADWPQISLHFSDLEGEHPNDWRNIQDTVQMLAHTTLEAIEQGFLDVRELAEDHKTFLGSVTPFLLAVGFPRYENSGSWEEVAAVRTSVMAIETALLHKIKSLHHYPSMRFLADGYERGKPQTASGSFRETVDTLLQNGLHELGRRLPFESPEYPAGSVKHRQADAALAYVLRYGIPQLLAGHRTPMAYNNGEPMQASAIEDLVLAQITSLQDPATRGIVRYEDDSYQRVNFHTAAVQAIVKAIKQKVRADARNTHTEVNLDEKQALRHRFTPEGAPAAWTHPLGQLASWAACRSIDAQHASDTAAATRYQALGAAFLTDMLSTITGEHDWQAAQDSDGNYRIKQAPAHKLPECYVTYAADGRTFTVPSPHTPLNWSTAMLREAVGMFHASLSSGAKKSSPAPQ